MHLVVTGSSGLIGSALVKRLTVEGHQVTRLVRRTPRPGEARWDPATGSVEVSAFEGCDAVVHLAGAGIGDHRWTAEYKRELRDGRVRGTELIASTIASLDRPPNVLLSASAVGYYGSRGDEELDESSPPGTGFLADLCRDWEQATAAAAEAGVRVVTMRSGVVFAEHGGALKKQLPLYKWGLGGKVGSGRQWQSWIALDDEIEAILHLLSSELSGPVNVTAPNPVTQATFADTLGEVLGRPTFLPTPGFAPKLLLGGELVENLLLTGQRVLPRALLDDGYVFRFAELEGALRSILRRPVSS